MTSNLMHHCVLPSSAQQVSEARAATGAYVTREWPMEDVPEEANIRKDHRRQRGIFFAHDDVHGIDFWNNEMSYKEPPKRGVMVLRKVDKVT